ncbi:hypothetical protein C0991_008271 [Blastosporella zonata]|nr:hypothetical protein C0991_008271 [Blastosporella zonata]
MGNDSVYRLPAYPSTAARKSLSPSQLANINQAISSSLLQTIALPPSKRDSPAARTFVASYAKDTALQALQGLIWQPSPLSKDEKIIRKRALLLAEKVAPALDTQTLLDLAIVYAPTHGSQIGFVFEAALKANPLLVQSVEADLVPAFTHLFNPAQGLYAIRKAAFCVSSFLQACPSELVRCFGRSHVFVLALATLYDQGLGSIAQSYGGLSVERNSSAGTVDEWEPIWVQTKVDLIDAFHVVISALLNDLSASSGLALAAESERTFSIIFALLELPSSSNSSPTPFLNRSLLTDYQTSYSLSKTLSTALRSAAEKDARLDLLESTLQSLESPSPTATTSKRRDAGALKILLGSSGISPGIDNRGDGGRVRSTIPTATVGNGKGKERAPEPAPTPASSSIPDLDVKITQVLDIFPDHAPEYVRALLERPAYEGDPEKVVMALLEGSAPGPEEVQSEAGRGVGSGRGGEGEDDLRTYVNERRNVFDDEMDLSQLRVGKAREDASSVLRDRTFIEQMKADILRRAEAISDDEEDEESEEFPASKSKGLSLAFDEDEEGGATVKIGGDGEESGDSDTEDEEGDGLPEKTQDAETILELAYIRDPKLFDRDMQTRRSKARADLKAQTGWDDPQIEGWRIMLERNPRKDKILQKHEFSGNQPSIPVPIAGPSNQNVRGGDRGHGGRGRGRGGGGGRGRGGGVGGADSARERAWKDKNKASRGNHNRKRGHDKKMARAGAGVPPP